MRLRDFELMSIDLELGDAVYDLHNNFDFSGFSYDVPRRELVLRWVRSKGECVPADSPSQIVVTAHGVTYLAASPRSPEMPFSEDDCLNCVSVVGANQPAEESFITAEAPSPELHYVLQFMSGFTLRVQAEEATCRIV